MFKNYYQAVKYIGALNYKPQANYMASRHQDGRFFLWRMKELAQKIKLDLKQFKVIHIAGTAGKGTTTAMVHNILYQAGKKVGSYYSPHPTTTIERIKANQKFISPDEFAKCVNKLKPVIKDMAANSAYGAPSYFEILLAVALKYFQQKKCEYIVLETGCGGKFDATNIMPRPLITAITNIGYDHTQLLGKTLIKIATTKAGIIKTGSKFITTEKRPSLLKIFKKICQQKKAQFISIKPNRANPLENNRLLATRIATELKIKQKFIKLGIEQTKLSCRFEIIQKNPLVILDGAHNLDKLKTTFKNLAELKFNKLWLIFTLNANKDIENIIKYIVETRFIASQKQTAGIILTKHLVSERQVADLKMMRVLFKTAFGQIINNKTSQKRLRNLKIKIINKPHQALRQALKKASQNDLILITGSFYLAGELRKNWISEEKILKKRC